MERDRPRPTLQQGEARAEEYRPWKPDAAGQNRAP